MQRLKTNLATFLIIAVISLFTACERETEHHHTNVSEITLTITSPIASQEFEAGDTVKIKGAIDASEEMHGYEVHLTRLSDNTEVMNKTYGTHAKHYTLVKPL